MIPSGLISTSSIATGSSSISAASLANGSADSPWNERVQSTWRMPSSRIKGSSESPPVKSWIGDWPSIEEALVLDDREDTSEAAGGGFEAWAGLRTYVDAGFAA